MGEIKLKDKSKVEEVVVEEPVAPKQDAKASISQNKQIDELRRALKASKEENAELKSFAAQSIVELENKIKRNYKHKRELAKQMADFHCEYIEEVRTHKGFSGQRLTKRVFDESSWTKEQLQVRSKYKKLVVEGTRLYDTLIAVTLIDDPDVSGAQLNCGVNAEILGLYYSGEQMLNIIDLDEESGKETSKRVQLIPYKFYEAIMRSFRIKYKPETRDNGSETNIALKVRPVIEAKIPTEEMLKLHAKMCREQNRRF